MALNKQSRRISKYAHDVYRVYGEDGALLYVGCSVNVFARMYEHKQYASWWHLAAGGTVHRYPNRAHALSVEAAAILNERPSENKVVERLRAAEQADPSAVIEEVMQLVWIDGKVYVDG